MILLGGFDGGRRNRLVESPPPWGAVFCARISLGPGRGGDGSTAFGRSNQFPHRLLSSLVAFAGNAGSGSAAKVAGILRMPSARRSNPPRGPTPTTCPGATALQGSADRCSRDHKSKTHGPEGPCHPERCPSLRGCHGRSRPCAFPRSATPCPAVRTSSARNPACGIAVCHGRVRPCLRPRRKSHGLNEQHHPNPQQAGTGEARGGREGGSTFRLCGTMSRRRAAYPLSFLHGLLPLHPRPCPRR